MLFSLPSLSRNAPIFRRCPVRMLSARPKGLGGGRPDKSSKTKALMFNPLEIPADAQMINGSGKPTNIFVQNNMGSKFILLNRPSALNALDLGMIHDLYDTYVECDGDESCGLLVLYGAGSSFCAGGDVARLAKMGPQPMGKGAPQMDFFLNEYRLNHHIGTLKRQTQVSVLWGFVMGGGAGLSMHGQKRIVTDNTKFAMPETALGLFPDIGSSYFLTKLCKARPGLAMYLALTGRRITGTEMYNNGLASNYVSMGQFPGLFERLLTIDNYTEQRVTDILLEFSEYPPREQDLLTSQRGAIERCFTKDSLPAIREALKAESTGEHAAWAKESIALLDKASPTSLAVSFELFHRAAAKDFSLEKSLITDARVARRFMAGGEFFEGVRAMLLDKDRNPKWAPTPTPEQVAAYFEPLPAGEKELVLPARS